MKENIIIKIMIENKNHHIKKKKDLNQLLPDKIYQTSLLTTKEAIPQEFKQGLQDTKQIMFKKMIVK
jgi:hypothetical protein